MSGVLFVTDNATGRELQLDPMTAFVWEQSDGNKSAAEITTAARQYFQRPITAEEVWSAIDWLTEAGLLAERVAPPAAPSRMSRREVLGTSMSAPALLAGAFVAATGVARAQATEQNQKQKQQEANQKQAQEQNQKKQQQQEQKQKQHQECRAKRGDDDGCPGSDDDPSERKGDSR